MPRKPLLYCSGIPYHVTARANNKEWFYLPIDQVWEIFASKIAYLQKHYEIKVFAFVLMSNHYHLLLETSDKFYLGEVMQILQKSVSREINFRAGRMNHVFGGPYKGCIVGSPNYYAAVLKYIYRNPVQAGLCFKAEEYRFSTMSASADLTRILLSEPTDFMHYVPSSLTDFCVWINRSEDEAKTALIAKALHKTGFKLAKADKLAWEQLNFSVDISLESKSVSVP